MTQLHGACLQQLQQLEQRRYRKVALLLGDQLNAQHSWFHEKDADTLFVMFEMRQETDYCRHHIQKIVGFFMAMRHFANALANAGHSILYFSLDNTDNQQNLTANLDAVIKATGAAEVWLQQPDEYRVDKQLQEWVTERSDVSCNWFDSEHFLTQRDVLQQWFGASRNYLMESFYRRVRKQTGYLMEGGEPVGGKWNYDKENRKKITAKQSIPQPLTFSQNVSAIVDMINKAQIKTIGKIDVKQFMWPVTRQQSKQLLDFFIDRLLPSFGDYQDAMVVNEWSLYHSRVSFALNSKMLSPRYVVERAIAAWQAAPEQISLNQIEGFIRQIIGWREFVRAIYWQFMPEYGAQNHFEYQQQLPTFYWDADTKMNCLQQSIQQSLDFAYAHHIQRLMITGNFALLTECDPSAVDAWYLGIYLDALEWVELPNTRGMSQFADGGILATKPYVSSGSYIQKMSNYCDDCAYNVKAKTGKEACPFNLLYWHFIDRHHDKLVKNGRMGLILKQWEKRASNEKRQIIDEAQAFLDNLPRT